MRLYLDRHWDSDTARAHTSDQFLVVFSRRGIDMRRDMVYALLLKGG
jgi:hypothetical protein